MSELAQQDERNADLPEISIATYDAIDRWRDAIECAPKIDKRNVFEAAAEELYVLAQRETDLAAFESIRDDIFVLGERYARLSPDDVDYIVIGAQARAEVTSGLPLREIEPPPPNGPEDYGAGAPATKPEAFTLPPLTIGDWLSRELSSPDFILGNWLSTTTRGLLVAPTGLGKTNFALALALHVAAGADFLHWLAQRPCKVLYIDGEMSRRLLRQRIADAVARLGSQPEGFCALSAEDVEGFSPLNTSHGQAYIDRLLAEIKPDLIIFDSIMCLTIGDMKEGESWAQIMPWIRSLTRRCIGQLWVHHTGHDESRSYGDKTKEWQLDTVAHMEAAARDDTDVSFSLEFRKARERTPGTRADFQTARIALVADQWIADVSAAVRPGHVSPLGLKFLDALQNALATDGTEIHLGHRAATLDHWRAECVAMGLLEAGNPIPSPARALFSKHRRELIGANRIACDERLAWAIR